MRSKDFNNVMFSGPASSEEICRNVASDFKLQGLTQAKAAAQLGIEPKAVANQISGKRAFGKKAAKLYAKTFGYNEAYLLYGEGGLKVKVTPGNGDRAAAPAEADMITIPRKDYIALENRVALLEKLVTMIDVQPKNISPVISVKAPTKKGTVAQRKSKVNKVDVKLK